MKIIRTKNYDEMSWRAAQILLSQLIVKPSSVLGLATGSTPIGVYEHLVRAYQKNEVDFSKMHTVNLDEYYGLAKDNPQSYAYFMNKHLFDHINVSKENTHIPSGLADDPILECKRYDERIENLGIDLQLLGVGHNGHIGFNEPSDCFTPTTHLVHLSQKTIDANARFFENRQDVPKEAITMGIKSILSAKKIVLVASGADKSSILKKMILGKVQPQVPASILQLHGDVTIVADEAALSEWSEEQE